MQSLVLIFICNGLFLWIKLLFYGKTVVLLLEILSFFLLGNNSTSIAFPFAIPFFITLSFPLASSRLV